MSRKSISHYTVAELLLRAAEFDAMAATARTIETKLALEALAARFRILASARAVQADTRIPRVLRFLPGEAAPCAGLYELYDTAGVPVGTFTRVEDGQPFPSAPQGFDWQIAE